jgi:diguanylate cyclase (GGDEF)-like protein
MGASNIIIYVPPALFSIVAIAFFVLWRLKVIASWHWGAGFAQTALGFVLSTFSIQPMFDAFSSGLIFIGAAYCYGSGLLTHFHGPRLRAVRLGIVAVYIPMLAYLVFVEQSLIWQLFLTDAVFALLLGIAITAIGRNAFRAVDKALVVASVIVVLDSVLRTAFFTFFTESSDDLGDFANSAYNLAVHVSTITVCMIFPFTALGAIASAAIERHRDDAERDHLTGLLNRRGFEQAIERDHEAGPDTGTAIVFDIDHFKRVNDSYGHAFGDEVITALANVLKKTIGTAGYLARVGGEEFIAFIPGRAEQESEAIADLVRVAFASTAWAVSGPCAAITVSGGLSEIRDEANSLERAFLRADGALYAAKAGGRDRICRADRAAGSNFVETESVVIPFKPARARELASPRHA